MTKSRPFIEMTVTIVPCSVVACLPMELDKWKADMAEPLMTLFNTCCANLKNQPGTVIDTGSIDFFGKPMMFAYHLGQTSRADENDNPKTTYGHAYALFYNDGIMSIRVVTEYSDLPMKDVATMASVVPRDTYEKITRAFMDKYTHEW
jgi:hypothetical protein